MDSYHKGQLCGKMFPWHYVVKECYFMAHGLLSTILYHDQIWLPYGRFSPDGLEIVEPIEIVVLRQLDEKTTMQHYSWHDLVALHLQ